MTQPSRRQRKWSRFSISAHLYLSFNVPSRPRELFDDVSLLHIVRSRMGFFSLCENSCSLCENCCSPTLLNRFAAVLTLCFVLHSCFSTLCLVYTFTPYTYTYTFFSLSRSFKPIPSSCVDYTTHIQ